MSMRVGGWTTLWLCCVLACFTPHPAAAQSAVATVRGTVHDAGGRPLPGVLVLIDGTPSEAVTDGDGRFRLTDVPVGERTLRARLTGFEPVAQALNLMSGESRNVTLSLLEGAHLFERVVVVEEGYAGRRSVASTRTGVDLSELPQSVQVINKDVIADQGATYLNDALKNASGVTMFSEYLDFNLRGFRAQADGAVKVDGLNQVQDFFFKPRLLNIERVEVVKGPAGALFGQSTPGGFVNIVSKQPSAQRQGRAAVHLGSWDKSEVHLSSTGPVPSTSQVFYLVDAARIDNQGFRSHEHFVYTGLAGSLTWAPSARTALTVGGEWFDDLAQGHRNRGVPFFEHRLVDVPARFTVNEPDDQVHIQANIFRGRLDHEFSNDWRLDASVSRLDNSSVQQYHEPRGLLADGRTMLREFRDQYREKGQTAAAVNVNWTPGGAGVSHAVLVGAEYTLSDGLLRSGTARDSARGGPVPDIDIYAPTYGSPGRPLHFGYYDVPGGITALTTSTNNRVRATGFYVQDHVRLGARTSLLGGIRYDEFRDDTRGGAERSRAGSAISFRGGGVVDLVDGLSAYGSYSEGFEPPPASLSLDPDRYGGPFDPEDSWSAEGGFKGAWLRNRLTSTVAWYHITKRNMLLYSPTLALPDRYVQIGAFESRGLEVDVAGRLGSRASIYGNVTRSFTAEVTDDVNPANIGKPAENNPRTAANVWARVDAVVAPAWKLAFGGGVTYVGDRLTFEAGDVLPSYARTDLAVFFDVHRVQTSLNVFNVTGARYFTGGYGGRVGGFLGAPRSVELRVAYRF
jgi:iron complex outermembrane receptor protein